LGQGDQDQEPPENRRTSAGEIASLLTSRVASRGVSQLSTASMDAVFTGFDDFARFGDLACAELKRQGLQVFDQLRRRPPAADGPSVPALATGPSGSGSRHWKPSSRVQDLLCRRGMSGRTARTCCDAGTAKLMLTGSRKPLLHQSGEARLRLGSRMPCGQRRPCDLTPQPALRLRGRPGRRCRSRRRGASLSAQPL
jgi:hypothetical protein